MSMGMGLPLPSVNTRKTLKNTYGGVRFRGGGRYSASEVRGGVEVE